ncbi:hypothetical protein AAZX31_08G260000 [Glycine max]|nr:hypothetical protein GLYMA_08G267151v4 [Glycine max]KAH1053261.1 hypothetical protein GYH30_022507 [Glycine max]|eukprot:XP_006585874.1 uncharacterized protein LOC102661692 [Glycine max]
MIVYGGAGGVFLNSLWGVCLRNWNQTFVLVGGVCTYIRGDKVVVGAMEIDEEREDATIDFGESGRHSDGSNERMHDLGEDENMYGEVEVDNGGIDDVEVAVLKFNLMLVWNMVLKEVCEYTLTTLLM